ncbi:hypothetical protein [Bradyrhizobium diazoefficiens]|uniref:hypothetical protein n=1 Tax=Bradyrhizobium diazoefficiens TaxID=1355477 RepID=UPI0036F43B31
MLKHGICTLEQLDRSELGRFAETRRFFHRLCDIALYEALARRGGSGDEALQAAVLNLFPITNGAYKRTSRERFGTFDREVLSILARLFSSNAPLSVHDVAVSDGRTACDFYRVLSAHFSELEFLASDLCLRVTRLIFSQGAAKCRGRRERRPTAARTAAICTKFGADRKLALPCQSLVADVLAASGHGCA